MGPDAHRGIEFPRSALKDADGTVDTRMMAYWRNNTRIAGGAIIRRVRSTRGLWGSLHWGPLLLYLGLLLAAAGPASAQYYFGKNKVQYSSFDWKVMTTEHFRLYFYEEESELAEIAGRSAEESYRMLAARFNHEIYSKIPLIIYSNPNFFVQTNITSTLLPENVAGFTEFIKGRVVVPFNGSFRDFDRVIRHELVHVFTLSKISRVEREYGRGSGIMPPLWFVEGLAECWSKPWDSEADLYVRDMVINGSLPSIAEFWTVEGSFFMYKLGESLCNFIQDQYGSDKLTAMFDNWWVGGRFEDIVFFTLGDDLKELSRKWAYALKKRYYPQLAALDLPDHDAIRLTEKQFAVRPVPVMLKNEDGRDERWVIFKANKVGYSGIYMMPADGNKKRSVTLLKGDRSTRYESLHLLTSGVDQFDNRLLVFSAKARERDVLYLYDLARRKVVARHKFTDLVGITSPKFSPDGTRVVFTGYRRSGYADLYLLDLVDGALTRLTDDIYNDQDPCFGYDGRSVIFSSDRGEEGYEGYLSLYRLTLADKDLTRLTRGRYHDRGATDSPDGSRIIFSSDRGSISAYNIFALDPDGNLSQLTRYITGAYDPRFDAQTGEIYFSAYLDRGYHVFKTRKAGPVPLPADSIPPVAGAWLPGKIDAATRAATVKYQTDYAFDIAQSAVAYDGVSGGLGGIQAAVSDVLGNNVFIFLLANTARTKDDLLSSFNGALTYVRRTSRFNFGLGAFHLYDEYYNDFDGYYYERLVGGVFSGSYPLSKFDRLESSIFVRYSDKDIYTLYSRRQALLATPTLSFISDNTLWESTGPLEGRRLNVTVGITHDFRSDQEFSRMVMADFRHYLRLRMLSCIASRFYAYQSTGIEPQRMYLGGSWSFRGYSRRHFYNRNILFNSEELRFPLINDFLVDFPVGSFRLRGIRGALFHDVGTAWDNQWHGWIGSFGASVRIALGYLVVLRFDFSRTHDFRSISDHTRTDFFFGWNF